MAGLPGVLDRRFERLLIGVAIAEHKVGRPRLKQLDDLRRPDVSAMQYVVDFEAFKHSDRRPSELHVPVGIAHDADAHD